MKTTCCMPCGLSERGGASLKSDVLKMQSRGLHCILKPHPLVDCLTMSCVRFKVVGFLTGHPATKSKLLEEWTWLVHLLYDCLFTFLQSVQCCGGKHGFLLVQLRKQLDEVCHNHTPSRHTSIITSQIRFADDNFTYIDCNSMIFKDALGLTVGDYPESCSWPTSDMSLFQIEDSFTDQCRWISLKHA